MKKILFGGLFCFLTMQAPAQQSAFTQDGNFAGVIIDKSLKQNDPVLVLKSTNRDWKKEIAGIRQYSFSMDSKYCFYQRHDTLFRFSFLNNRVETTTNVGSFILGNHTNLLRIRPKYDAKVLLIENLNLNEQTRFDNVSFYQMNGDESAMAIKQGNELSYYNLKSGQKTNLYTGTEQVRYYKFDNDGRQVVFMTEGKAHNTIWYYHDGERVAVPLLTDSTRNLPEGFKISSQPRLLKNPFAFSPKGEKLVFYLAGKPSPPKNSVDPISRTVDVWAYFDPKFQTTQLKSDTAGISQAAVYSFQSKQIIKLEHPNEIVLSRDNSFPQINDDYALVCHFDKDVLYLFQNEPQEDYIFYEYNWNKALRSTIYLVSLKDGSKTLISQNVRPYNKAFPYYRLLPQDLVLYYDQSKCNYFTYQIKEHRYTNITARCPTTWNSGDDGEIVSGDYYANHRLMGLRKDFQAALLLDTYGDIWEADLTGNKSPKLVTNRIAKNQKLSFSPYNTGEFFREGESLYDGQHAYLFKLKWNSYNSLNAYKNAGIAEIQIDHHPRLTMLVANGGPYHYSKVVRSDKGSYLVERQNSQEPRTCWLTNDFKKFEPITSNKASNSLKPCAGQVKRFG